METEPLTIAQLIRTDRPHIAESSLKTYMFSLKKLNIINVADVEKLSDPNAIFDEIKDMKITQQRNLLSSILIILKATQERKDLYEIYRAKTFELGCLYNEELAKNEKTETQEKNWVKLDELKKITRKLVRKNPKSQKSLIAALYSYQPPLRLDYYDMQLIENEDGVVDKTKNYLLITSSRKKTFILNDYKTSNKYDEVRVPVSKELNRVLNKFLKLNEIDRKYLLQNKQGGPMSRNQLGKLIPEVFKATGKNVTLNIIRHVFVSESIDLEAVKQFQNIAACMLHSSSEQQNYAKLDKN